MYFIVRDIKVTDTKTIIKSFVLNMEYEIGVIDELAGHYVAHDYDGDIIDIFETFSDARKAIIDKFREIM